MHDSEESRLHLNIAVLIVLRQSELLANRQVSDE